jgi:hypothetical protein
MIGVSKDDLLPEMKQNCIQKLIEILFHFAALTVTEKSLSVSVQSHSKDYLRHVLILQY